MNCEGCGACCMDMDAPLFDEEELASLHPTIRREYNLLMGVRKLEGCFDGGPCFWLDQQTCRCIRHEHRPQVCWDFVVGSVDCLARRDHLLSTAGQPALT